LGYTAFGHINPFLDEGHEQVYFKPHVKKMQDAAENVRRMREVVGDKVDLLVELHRRLTPTEAFTFINMIEEYNPLFIKDPIRPENADAMARVADRITVPIATGERFSTIYKFQSLLSRNAPEYVRIDVALRWHNRCKESRCHRRSPQRTSCVTCTARLALHAIDYCS
jgi:galactonate dehydratase